MIQDDNKRSRSPAEKAENPKAAYCVHCESLTIALYDESGYEFCGKCKCALLFGEDYDRSFVCLIEDLSNAVGFSKTLELVAQCVQLNIEDDTNRAQTWQPVLELIKQAHQEAIKAESVVKLIITDRIVSDETIS